MVWPNRDRAKLILSGSNSYTGTTSITGGTLTVSTDSNLGNVNNALSIGSAIFQTNGGSSVSMPASRQIALQSSTSTIQTLLGTTIAGVISGSGKLNKTGSATLWITGDSNTYSGGTAISAGTLSIGNGGTTGSLYGNVSVASGAFLKFNRSDALGYGYSGNISGAGTVIQGSSGILGLFGTNTYSGGTQVNDGVLAFSSNTNLGTGQVVISDGATLWWYGTNTADVTLLNSNNGLNLSYGSCTLDTGANNVTLSKSIGGGGTLVKDGSGAMTLSGVNTYTGGTVVNAGNLFTGVSGALPTGRPVTLSGTDGTPTALVLNGHDQSISGLTIYASSNSATGGFEVTVGDFTYYTSGVELGTGTLTLTGDMQFLSNDATPGYGFGALIQSNVTAPQVPGSLNLGGSTRTITITGNANPPPSYFDLSISAPITNGGLIITGTNSTYNGTKATVALTGANTYTLGTTINNTLLAIESDDNLGNASGSLTLNNAEVQAYDTISSSRSITLVSGSNNGIDTNGNDITLSGIITGSGALTKLGSGTLFLTNSNTYTGDTTISGGSIIGSVDGAIPASSAVSVASGATLNLASDQTIGTLSGAGAVVLNSNVLSTDGNPATSFSGSISGTGGSLIKSGDGTLALTGASSYTGGTTLSDGTLLVNNSTGSGTGTGPVTLDGGTLAGSGTIAGTVTAGSSPLIAGSGAHAINPGPTGPNSVGTLTVGGLTTSSDTTLAFDLTSPESGSTPSVNDVLNVTGTDALTLDGGTLVITANPIGNSSLGYYRAIAYAGSIQGGDIDSITLPAYSSHNIAYTLYKRATGYVDIHRGYIGDGNDDGTVDLSDLNLVLNNFGLMGVTWSDGDVNGTGDGDVDLSDLNAVLNNFGNSLCPMPEEMMSMRFGSEDLTPWIDHLLDMVAGDGETIDETELADLRAYAETIPGYAGDEEGAAFSVQVVPEPGGGVMLLGAASAMALGRRRRCF